MRALHTTEMLISGAFPRASRRFRASPLRQAAPGPRAGDPRCPAAAAHGTLIPSGPSAPQCPGVPRPRAEAPTPHVPAGTRCRGPRLDTCLRQRPRSRCQSHRRVPHLPAPRPAPASPTEGAPAGAAEKPRRPWDPPGSPLWEPVPAVPSGGARGSGGSARQRSGARRPSPGRARGGAEGNGGGGGARRLPAGRAPDANGAGDI